MPRFINQRLLCTVIISLVVSGTVNAQNIYKWKDQDGITHYGELPPTLAFSSVERLEVQPPVPERPASGGSDYRSVLELANSLQAGRLEREKLRLEKNRLAQRDRQALLEAQRYNETYRTQSYNEGYYPYRTYSRPSHSKPHSRPPHGQGSGSVSKRVYLGR